MANDQMMRTSPAPSAAPPTVRQHPRLGGDPADHLPRTITLALFDAKEKAPIISTLWTLSWSHVTVTAGIPTGTFCFSRRISWQLVAVAVPLGPTQRPLICRAERRAFREQWRCCAFWRRPANQRALCRSQWY